MSSEVIFGIDGVDSEKSRLEVINALHRYSGVLDVDLNPGHSQIRVRYDATNILANDIKETLEDAGYHVRFIQQ